MIAQAYGREAQVEMVLPRQVRAIVGSSANPAAAAHDLGVDQYILVNAVHLASKISMHASLRDTEGREVFAIDMLATSLDDLPQVSARMAKALVERKNPEEVLTRRNVTGEETTTRNRVSAQKIIGFKTAFAWPVAQGARFDGQVTLAFDLRYETEWYLLEFGAGLTLSSGGSYQDLNTIFAEFSGNRYLLDADNSPYIGIGVSPRVLISSSNYNSSGRVGIAPFLQVGYMFFRASRTRLYVDLRATQNLVALQYYDACGLYYSCSSRSVYPTELGLYVGIGW